MGAAALDEVFGTFKANFDEAHKDETVQAPEDAKSVAIVDAQGVHLPTLEFVAYLALSTGCLAAWAWAVVGLPGAPPFPLPRSEPMVALGLSVLAGFGPVWVAQLMGLKALGGDGNVSIVVGKTWAEWRAALFHYVIGAFFCAVPITFACWLALQTPKDIMLFWATAWSLTPSAAAVAAAYFFVMPALDILQRCL